MHPQGCQILSLDPLLFGLNHMPVKIGTPGRIGLPALQSVSPDGTFANAKCKPTCIADVRSVALW